MYLILDGKHTYLISLSFSSEKVLDGNKEAAALLAQEVHEDVNMATDPLADGIGLDLPDDNVGVWIDPIGE